MLLLPIYKHGWSSYLLISSSISSFNNLKLLSSMSFTCLVRGTPQYLILFEIMVKCVVSQFIFSFLFLICLYEDQWSLWVNFLSRHFADCIYELKNFHSEFQVNLCIVIYFLPISFDIGLSLFFIEFYILSAPLTSFSTL